MSLDIRDQAAAVITAIQAQGVTVHDTQAPDAASGGYAVVTMGRRFGGATRLYGTSADRGSRIVVLAVGDSAWQARWVEERVTTALSGKRLTITGVVCTRTEFESSRPVGRERDSTVFSGTTVWTFVANPAA